MAAEERASRKRRRSGSEGSEGGGLQTPLGASPSASGSSDSEGSEGSAQPKQAFDPQTDFTEGELAVRRTRRGVYEGRKGEEEEEELPSSTAGRVKRRGNGR